MYASFLLFSQGLGRLKTAAQTFGAKSAVVQARNDVEHGVCFGSS